MKLNNWTQVRSFISHHLIIVIFLLLYLAVQCEAEIERNRRSNDLNTNTADGGPNSNANLSSFASKLEEASQEVISKECTRHMQYWMENISTTINKENATLVVDWSDLDQLLLANNCPYVQLWIELWRVNEGKVPLDNQNTVGNLLSSVDDKEETFGTPTYFSKYDRCNKLDESLFAYHSTRAHDGNGARYNKVIPKEEENRIGTGYDEEGNGNQIVSMYSNELVAMEKSDSAMDPTRTTFLHVVETSYILRLCPCGKIRKHSRVCDCEYTDALCSGVIKIQQPPELEVYPWCRQTKSNLEGTDVNKLPSQAKDENTLAMNSPQTTCDSVLLAGSLKPCTPVQSYDRVKVILHPVTNLDLRLMEIDNIPNSATMKTEQPISNVKKFKCDWSRDFGHHHPESSDTAVVREEKLIASREGKTRGDFSVLVNDLKENSTFCVQVELVDHPYCNSHLTIGHQLQQPLVCINHVSQPVIVPPCKGGPINIGSKTSIQNRIVFGILAGMFLILVCLGVFVLYIRRKIKKRSSGSESTTNIRSKQYKNLTPIIKNGALVPYSTQQANSCSNGALLSKSLKTVEGGMLFPDIFLLYFPDTKHFEEINVIFRDWLASLGSRVYDLSDSQYDEQISKDPEDWVMKILMKPNIRVVVLESPVARFSLALASSSTATTSLVSSTISVDSIAQHNDEDDVNEMGEDEDDDEEEDPKNSKELEEDEETEIRIPLSHKPSALGNPGGGKNVVEASRTTTTTTAVVSNHHYHLPDCAIEDNRYELRVFAMKMIQSRFIGKYKQVIVVGYENGGSGGASLPPLTEQTIPSATTASSSQSPALYPSYSSSFKESSSSSCSKNNRLIGTEGGTVVATTATGTNTIHLQEIARILTPHKQCLLLPQHMPELRSWLRGHGDLYCGEGNNEGNLSDLIIETDDVNQSAAAAVEAAELPSECYHKNIVSTSGGKYLLPQFHRYRLTSTAPSSQAYCASSSASSHPSSPALLSSAALESKLRSSLSTSSSSSTSSTSSSSSANPYKSYSTRNKSTSCSATTTSIV